jgi:hypothetical protein
MRQLQIEGALRLGYRQIEGVNTPVMTIAPAAEDWEDTRVLKKLLGLAAEKNTFTIDTRGNLPRADSIGIELRSLLSTFFFVSHGVNIPTSDAQLGRAMITRYKNGQPFGWSLVVGDLVDVRSKTKKPDNARIAVKYRDAWFYIDDSDLNTKYTLLLLEQLAALLGGKVGHDRQQWHREAATQCEVADTRQLKPFPKPETWKSTPETSVVTFDTF